jgi:hypothetical protein
MGLTSISLKDDPGTAAAGRGTVRFVALIGGALEQEGTLGGVTWASCHSAVVPVTKFFPVTATSGPAAAGFTVSCTESIVMGSIGKIEVLPKIRTGL